MHVYSYLLVVLILGPLIVWWIGGGLILRRNGKWWPCSYKGERVMRRYVGGKWETRPMTPDEKLDDFSDRAW
jgi:hypothetical protein